MPDKYLFSVNGEFVYLSRDDLLKMWIDPESLQYPIPQI